MTHTVKTIIQLFQSITDQAVSLVSAKNGHVLEITGQLGDIKEDERYPIVYGLKLKDGTDYILLDIPRAIIKQRALFSGQFVKVTGKLKGTVNEFTQNRLDLRIDASDIVGITAPADIDKQRKAQENLTSLMRLNSGRHAFPLKDSFSMTLVTGRANKVEKDFMHAIAPIMEFITLTNVYVNMTDKHEITTAIQNARTDILCIIRGGGPESQFEVFNDPMVLSAIAKWPGYRVVGLGHSDDGTLCDLISDFSGETPGQAGVEIKEKYEKLAQLIKGSKESRKEADQLRFELAALKQQQEQKTSVKLKKSKLINLIITIVLLFIILVILFY